MIEMLFYTGCRPAELDRMKIDNLFENTLYWKLGKNQRSHRKEVLPAAYVKELREYRETHAVPQSKLFSMTADSLRARFNHHIRPYLGHSWTDKRLRSKNGFLVEEYILQIKGIRKTYQTMVFAQELKKWKSAEVAVEFTSKRMKHSSRSITCFHYIENFDVLKINSIANLNPCEAIKPVSQLRMYDFL